MVHDLQRLLLDVSTVITKARNKREWPHAMQVIHMLVLLTDLVVAHASCACKISINVTKITRQEI